MSVPQFTTPTFTLTFRADGLDLTEARNVYVTFKTRYAALTKSGEDLEIGEKTIGVYLNQEETGKLGMGECRIQANWTLPSGRRAASVIAAYPISEQLLKGVIE